MILSPHIPEPSDLSLFLTVCNLGSFSLLLLLAYGESLGKAMPTGSTTTLCFLQLLVGLQSFSASFHSSRPFPITFRKSSSKPFSAFSAQSKVQNSHIEEIVSLNFPLHNLRFLLYLLYSSFLSFPPLSEVWEWKRTTPFLSKACFFTRILIPFFFFHFL